MARRVTPPTPDHYRTYFYSQVELALRQGYEVVVCLKGAGRRKIVAVHKVGDRVLYFDPLLNPSPSYQHGAMRLKDLAARDRLPTARDEGNGLLSLEAGVLQRMFLDGATYAMVPQAFRYAV